MQLLRSLPPKTKAPNIKARQGRLKPHPYRLCLFWDVPPQPPASLTPCLRQTLNTLHLREQGAHHQRPALGFQARALIHGPQPTTHLHEKPSLGGRKVGEQRQIKRCAQVVAVGGRAWRACAGHVRSGEGGGLDQAGWGWCHERAPLPLMRTMRGQATWQHSWLIPPALPCPAPPRPACAHLNLTGCRQRPPHAHCERAATWQRSWLIPRPALLAHT